MTDIPSAAELLEDPRLASFIIAQSIFKKDPQMFAKLTKITQNYAQIARIYKSMPLWLLIEKFSSRIYNSSSAIIFMQATGQVLVNFIDDMYAILSSRELVAFLGSIANPYAAVVFTTTDIWNRAGSAPQSSAGSTYVYIYEHVENIQKESNNLVNEFITTFLKKEAVIDSGAAHLRAKITTINLPPADTLYYFAKLLRYIQQSDVFLERMAETSGLRDVHTGCMHNSISSITNMMINTEMHILTQIENSLRNASIVHITINQTNCNNGNCNTGNGNGNGNNNNNNVKCEGAARCCEPLRCEPLRCELLRCEKDHQSFLKK